MRASSSAMSRRRRSSYWRCVRNPAAAPVRSVPIVGFDDRRQPSSPIRAARPATPRRAPPTIRAVNVSIAFDIACRRCIGEWSVGHDGSVTSVRCRMVAMRRVGGGQWPMSRRALRADLSRAVALHFGALSARCRSDSTPLGGARWSANRAFFRSKTGLLERWHETCSPAGVRATVVRGGVVDDSTIPSLGVIR